MTVFNSQSSFIKIYTYSLSIFIKLYTGGFGVSIADIKSLKKINISNFSQKLSICKSKYLYAY